MSRIKHLSILPVILLWMMPIFLAAQSSKDLHIHYDFVNESIRYEKGKKTIKKPRLGNGGKVFIHVSEFNDYLYAFEVEVNSKVYEVGTASISQMFDPMKMTRGAGFSQAFALSSAGTNSEKFYQQSLNLAENASAAMAVYASSASKVALALSQKEQEMERQLGEMELINKSSVLRGVALGEVNKLKYNPRISPSKIRELSEEYIYTAFAKSKNEEIAIEDIVSSMDLSTRYKRIIDAYENNVISYLTLVSELGTIKEDVLNSDLGNVEAANFIREISQYMNACEQSEMVYRENLDKLNSQDIQSRTDQDLGVLSQLKIEYEELVNNDFKIDLPPISDAGDELNIKVKFMEKEGKRNTVKTLDERVLVSGNWKVNAGVGLTFAKLIDQPQAYDVKDGILIAEDLDDFTPLLATFVHFYFTGANTTSLGGSFGIGLPVLAGNSIESASFFLGPSLIFGQSERVILTGGMMGTQVERLSRGLKPGDSFDINAGSIPLKKRYEFGYFLGISFNLTR